MGESDQQALEERFRPRFSEVLETVASQLTFDEIYSNRAKFRDRILEELEGQLGGFVNDDIALARLEESAEPERLARRSVEDEPESPGDPDARLPDE